MKTILTNNFKNIKKAQRRTFYLDRKIKGQVNQKIQQLPTYGDIKEHIDLVKKILSPFSLKMVNEDGTDFQAIFSGENGKTHILIGNNNGEVVENSMFIFFWHKMESNKYELLGYMS